jgi:hypothetical protein
MEVSFGNLQTNTDILADVIQVIFKQECQTARKYAHQRADIAHLVSFIGN